MLIFGKKMATMLFDHFYRKMNGEMEFVLLVMSRWINNICIKNKFYLDYTKFAQDIQITLETTFYNKMHNKGD